MLLTLRARRTVLVVPLWVGLGALVCSALSVHEVLRGVEWQVLASSGVFALALGWLAVTELVVISVEQGVLRVWRFGQQRRLSAPDVALGVRLRPGVRATEYLVFASDGDLSCDLAKHLFLRRARRSVERIGQALFEPGHLPSAGAAHAVQAQELAWQASAEQTQRIVDEYYRSPAWKWWKRWLIAVVSTYVIGMALYQWLNDAP